MTPATPSDRAALFARVEARSLGRVYGRERALGNVSFILESGESAVLVGANGAGKSTLLGILSTLVRPSSGELLFGGAPPTATHRAAIGYLAHEPLCYGDLTARENLSFFARLYAAPASRVGELLARVGLVHAADRPARTYSRGMWQRLAIARATLHRPALLLLDEPFTGLDRDGCAMLAAILDEERARGAMLVLVSHDLEALPGLATRALVLGRGRLLHDGPAPATAEGYRALWRDLAAQGVAA